MRDEEYLFHQDVREKKHTGYSARKRRSHCGKAGCKMPSDNLTKKELMKMNGKCESYRLNEPMTFEEFKSMPDDIQKIYLTALREKYNVSDTQVAKMLCTSQPTLRNYLVKKGLNRSGKWSGKEEWDKEGFYAWANGIPKKEEPVEVVEEIPVEETTLNGIIKEIEATAEECANALSKATEALEPVKDETPCMDTSGKQAESESVLQYRKCVPNTGSLTYEGLTFDILSSVADLLGNSKVQLTVQWNVVE